MAATCPFMCAALASTLGPPAYSPHPPSPALLDPTLGQTSHPYNTTVFVQPTDALSEPHLSISRSVCGHAALMQV